MKKVVRQIGSQMNYRPITECPETEYPDENVSWTKQWLLPHFRVDEKRLLDAIVKYEALKGKDYKQENYIGDLIQSLQKQEKSYRTRFLIAGVDKFWALQVSDIAYFYSENKITFAVTKSGQEHIIDLSLTRLEEQLDPRRFFRANRQVIVCIDAIVHAAPYFNGRIILHVKPVHKDKITVSEEKVSSFKMWLNF